MALIEALTLRCRRPVAALALLTLAACAHQPEPMAGEEVAEISPPLVPVRSLPRRPVPVVPAPVAEPEREALPPPTERVAIVISGQQSAYANVASELAKRLDDTDVYVLDTEAGAASVFLRIGDSQAAAVVAVGLAAAQAAVGLATVPVIFCQVFNYRDAALVTDTSRGVAAIVPADAQLAAWKERRPALRRVGAIIGEGHEDLIDEAEIAASRYGLELTMAVVASDREAEYQFRRMVNEIDGFWLFPDNRVLSSRALRTMFEQARRRSVEIAVSSEALLSYGAGISLSPVPEDVADRVVGLLAMAQVGRLDSVPGLTPLGAVRVVTN